MKNKATILNILSFCLCLFSIPATLWAGEVVCTDVTTGQELRIEIIRKDIPGMTRPREPLTVSVATGYGNDEISVTLNNVKVFWDGRRKGLLIGEGLGILYTNSYSNVSIQHIDVFMSKDGVNGEIETYRFDDSCHFYSKDI